MVYQPIVNTPFDGTPPSDFCKRPNRYLINLETLGAGLGPLTGRHYGCFNAHRGALETMDDEFDYTLIFEADAFIFTGLRSLLKQFIKHVLYLKEMMCILLDYQITIPDTKNI
jgi:hypothetical protein